MPDFDPPEDLPPDPAPAGLAPTITITPRRGTSTVIDDNGATVTVIDEADRPVAPVDPGAASRFDRPDRRPVAPSPEA